MDKNVNLIIYKPGYGGHFIQFILSLDKSTVPIISRGVDFNQMPESRKEFYSFKDLRKTYGHWWNHHKKYQGRDFDQSAVHELLNNNNYHTLMIHAHPYEFYNTKLVEFLQNVNVSVNYLQIQLSPKYEYVIDIFKACNGNFPELRPGEEGMNQKITEQLSPYIINFDNFILGEGHFVEEYIKISNHLQLPLYLDDAIEMYRDWYIERRFSEYLKFGVAGEI